VGARILIQRRQEEQGGSAAPAKAAADSDSDSDSDGDEDGSGDKEKGADTQVKYDSLKWICTSETMQSGMTACTLGMMNASQILYKMN
jgi:hypothetical protein